LILNCKSYLNIILENHSESIDYTLINLINGNSNEKFIFESQLKKSMENLNDLLYKNEYGNKIKYFDKIKCKTVSSYFSYTSQKSRLDINLLELEDRIYDKNDTRYQTANDMKPKDYFGRFGVAYNNINLASLDKLGISIYQCESLCSFEEKEFSIHGGKGYTDMQSQFSALGESIERYSSRNFGYEEVLRDSYHNIKARYNVLDPNILELDANYINEYKDNKIFEWSLAYDLTLNESIYVPANTVYFPYNRSNEFMIHSHSTTGIASGYYIEEAILQGLLEVIERDSYSITHKAQLNIPNLNYVGNNETTNHLLDLCISNGVKVHLKLLDNKYSCYTVHCVLEDNEFPVYTHGSGTSMDIDTAINRAILEAFQMRTSQLQLKKNIDQFQDNEQNIYMQWGNGNKAYCFNFLNHKEDTTIFSSELNSRNTGNIKKDIKQIIRSLKIEGYRVLCADLSRIECPFKCVKVIIPGFQDIDNYNTRNTNRLKKALKNKKINSFPIFS
ncbi:TPA: YcaO-like family protein, partial [Staphylococcus pseudintermedius]